SGAVMPRYRWSRRWCRSRAVQLRRPAPASGPAAASPTASSSLKITGTVREEREHVRHRDTGVGDRRGLHHPGRLPWRGREAITLRRKWTPPTRWEGLPARLGTDDR